MRIHRKYIREEERLDWLVKPYATHLISFEKDFIGIKYSTEIFQIRPNELKESVIKAEEQLNNAIDFCQNTRN